MNFYMLCLNIFFSLDPLASHISHREIISNISLSIFSYQYPDSNTCSEVHFIERWNPAQARTKNMIPCALNILGWIYHLFSNKFLLLHYSLLKYEYLIVNYRTNFLISTKYYVLFQLLLLMVSSILFNKPYKILFFYFRTA